MRICYHGTTKDNADKILNEGFQADSWFAASLQDALSYGGLYVFQVVFDFDEAPSWQFHCLEPVPADRIVGLQAYTRRVIMENKPLREEIRRHNLPILTP